MDTRQKLQKFYSSTESSLFNNSLGKLLNLLSGEVEGNIKQELEKVKSLIQSSHLSPQEGKELMQILGGIKPPSTPPTTPLGIRPKNKDNT